MGALWAASSCAHSAPVVSRPEPCEALTEAQLAELEVMVERGDYPEVQGIISAYEFHCEEDDALAGR